MFPTNPAWYVAKVKPRHESVTSSWLRGRGLEVFNPVYRDVRRWSDRIKEIESPLFPGYVFCRFGFQQRMTILTTPSVTSIVSSGKRPAAVPDEEIAALEAIVASGRYAKPWPYTLVGHKVQVTRGCLAGLSGIVIREKSICRVVVNVDLLQRSVAVEIDRHDLTRSAGAALQNSAT